MISHGRCARCRTRRSTLSSGAYEQEYDIVPALRLAGERHSALRDAARIEAGLRSFLDAGGFKAFTDTFEDLGDLPQLPGLGVQRLMADGYGFGAEGDWKTAALLRAAKVMGTGLAGGSSFMEDYTYDLAPGRERVLGAHMLEVCPTIADGRPSCEIHPLSIGGRDDPVRLVFTARSGTAVVAALVDLGDRFRLLINEVELETPDRPLPNLPVARALWRPQPDLATAAEAWLVAGGPHHTVLSDALDTEAFADLAEIAGIELVVIDAAHERTRPRTRAGLERCPLPALPEPLVPFAELRERVVAANLALVEAGLVSLTFGNASVVDRAAGVLAIKPSGVRYDALRPEDVPVLDLATGAVVAGDRRPSSDAPTHLFLVRAFAGGGSCRPYALALCHRLGSGVS